MKQLSIVRIPARTSALTRPASRFLLALAAAGALAGGNSVFEVGPGGAVTTLATNPSFLNGNLGVVFDSAGNLYIGQDFTNSLTKMTPAGSLSNFTGNLGNGPKDTAIDSHGNLYTALDNHQIAKITSSGASSTFTSSLNRAFFLAFDSSDNLFVSDINTNQIDKFAAGSSTFSVFTTLPHTPESLAFDSAGNLFVLSNNQILKFASGSNSFTVFADNIGSGLSSYLAISNVDLLGTPEPSTWSMLALGGLALLAAGRKRKNSSV